MQRYSQKDTMFSVIQYNFIFCFTKKDKNNNKPKKKSSVKAFTDQTGKILFSCEFFST